MANVIDLIVSGKDHASRVFRQIGSTAERSFRQAEAAFERLENELRRIPDVEIDVDVSGAMAQIQALEARLKRLDHKEVEINIQTNSHLLLSSLLALGPAIAPILASTAAAVGGLSSAFAAAGIGVLAFGAVAAPTLRRVFEETENLTKKEREAQKALKDFQSFWSSFTRSFQTPILDLFIRSLGTLQTALVGLKPVFSSSIGAITNLFNQLDQVIKENEVQSFFQWLAANAGSALQSFGMMVGNVLSGVMNLLMAFDPLSMQMQSGLVGLTQRFANWTATLSKSQAFQQFISYVQTNGPVLMSILGQLGILFMNLVQAMAPFGQVILKVIDGFLRFTNQLLATHPTMGTLAIAMGALAGAAALLVKPIVAIIVFFTRLAPHLAKAGTAVMNFVKQFRSLTTIGMSGWSAGIVAFFVLLYNTSERFAAFLRGSFIGVWDSLKANFASLGQSFAPVMQSLSGLGQAFQSLWTTIQPLAEVIGFILVGAFVAVMAVVNGLLSALAPLIDVVVNVTSAVVWLADAFIKLLTGDISGFVNSWMMVGQSILNIIKNVGLVVLQLFTGMWNTLVQVAAQFGINLTTVVGSFFSNLVTVVTSILTNLVVAAARMFIRMGSAIMSASNVALSWLVARYNAAKAAVVSSLSSLRASASGIFNSLSSTIRSVTSAVVSFVTSRFNALRSQVVNVFNSARSAISSAMNTIANAIRSGFSRAVSAVVSAGSRIRSTLSNLARSAFSWGSNLAGMFARGISNKISAAVSAARSAAARIKSYLGFSSPTEKGPGRDADKWAPNLMSMFAKGIQAGIPQLEISSAKATTSLGSKLNAAPRVAGTTTANTNNHYTFHVYEAKNRPTEKVIMDTLRRAGWLYG